MFYILVNLKNERALMMETVFLLDMKHFLLTLIVINIVLIILITLFVKIVIIEPNKDSVSYKYWNWTERIVFQIVPGIILLIGIVFFVNIRGSS